MKFYPLTDEVSAELNKVTPKALKFFKTIGLFGNEEKKDSDLVIILNLFTDDEKMKEFVNLVFLLKQDIKYDEIDLSVLYEGYMDFFVQLIPSLPK